MSFEPFGLEGRVGVDAHELGPARAVVGELVWRVGRDDDDVAGAGAELFVAGVEGEASLDDDPGFIVVWRWSLGP